MFDTQSDYVLNKQDKEAIVCRSATGVHIRLTRANFSSEEEFLFWKDKSDADYKAIQMTGRDYYDNCISLIEALDSNGLSAEDILMAPLFNQEQEEQRTALRQKVRDALTEKQYRRMYMYYLQGMTEAQIAKVEGVGQRRISASISRGKAALKKFLKNF